MRAQVSPNAKVMEHPVESGGVTTDWRVIQPTEISMTVFLFSDDYASVYQDVKNLFIGTALLSVLTKADMFPNMLLAAMPHEEEPDQFDIIAMQLTFREAILVTAQFQALPAASTTPSNQSTVSRGEQQPQTVLLQGFNALFK